MTSRHATAVIGAGYGDEGKGLVTDLLAAARPGSVVVRSNGGAQAGHTVVTPAGVRHVFHHVCSGTFAGAATHLSAHFVAHPMMLLDEVETLHALGAKPVIGSDPRAIVTTPFDVMINQAVELARGNARHGSCGLGFGETIERNLRPEFRLTTKDLFRPDLEQRLEAIRARWLPERLAALGLDGLPAEITANVDAGEVIARFLQDCEAYLDHVALWPDGRIAEKGEIIFEGAQGLLLDQDFGAFPHVTRSNTGLKNMLAIAAEARLGAIRAVYATRCYVTRHGAGLLAHETASLEGIEVTDPTNAPNAWQGSLRLAPLDAGIVRDAIAHDLRLAADTTVRVDAALAVTCLDQVKGSLDIIVAGETVKMDRNDAVVEIARYVGMPLFGESRGPHRQAFRAHRPIAAG